MPVGPLQQPPVTTGANTGVSADILANLQGFRFGSVSFPCSQTSLELRQDLTIHKFADRDGAHVEGCGRHPVEITARIPFFNGLTPGSQEQWNSDDLYPNGWRLFFLQALDRSSKVLNHPELGGLTVKLQTCKTDWSADHRNGVWVDAKWLETDDTATELENSVASVGANSAALQAAGDLDTNLADPTLAPDFGLSVPSAFQSFTSMVQQAQSAITTATFVSAYVQNQITQMIYQATSIENSINLLGATLYPKAMLWPITQSAELLKDSAYTMQAQLAQKQPAISFYTAKADATLARVASILHVSVDDLVPLNIPFLRMGYVPAGSVVQYYTPSSR